MSQITRCFSSIKSTSGYVLYATKNKHGVSPLTVPNETLQEEASLSARGHSVLQLC